MNKQDEVVNVSNEVLSAIMLKNAVLVINVCWCLLITATDRMLLSVKEAYMLLYPYIEPNMFLIRIKESYKVLL